MRLIKYKKGYYAVVSGYMWWMKKHYVSKNKMACERWLNTHNQQK